MIAAARENLSEREKQLAEHLARVDQDLRALEHERRELAQRARGARRGGDASCASREEALREREETFRRRLEREARRAAARGAARDRRGHRGAEDADDRAVGPGGATEPRRRSARGETGAVRADARAAVERVVGRLKTRAGPTGPAAQPSPARPDRVGVAGDRRRPRPRRDVRRDRRQAGGDRRARQAHARERCSDLRVDWRAPRRAARRCNVNVDLQPREGSLSRTERHRLHGRRSDLARSRSSSTNRPSPISNVIRIVHGHGTGQLRRAIAAFLKEHPLVARSSRRRTNQGGGGVTVVELKD